MNVVNLAGNPTADPVESTYIYKDKDGNEKNGRRASFVLAVSVSNGRRYEEATFVRCVAFNNNAKIVIDRVKCGKKIIVQGHLKSGSFERDGVKQYTLDLIVDCIEFCQKATEEKENTEFVEMSENAQNEFFSVPEPGENDLPMPYYRKGKLWTRTQSYIIFSILKFQTNCGKQQNILSEKDCLLWNILKGKSYIQDR